MFVVLGDEKNVLFPNKTEAEKYVTDEKEKIKLKKDAARDKIANIMLNLTIDWGVFSRIRKELSIYGVHLYSEADIRRQIKSNLELGYTQDEELNKISKDYWYNDLDFDIVEVEDAN